MNWHYTLLRNFGLSKRYFDEGHCQGTGVGETGSYDVRGMDFQGCLVTENDKNSCLKVTALCVKLPNHIILEFKSQMILEGNVWKRV